METGATMPGISGILTGHTCGEACWEAREEICRCSCGGKNHGIHRRTGERPERTCRNGVNHYILVGVYGDYFQATRGMVTTRKTEFSDYYSMSRENYPVLVRAATKSQMQWPEVQTVESTHKFNPQKYLVWKLKPGASYPTK